MDVYSLRSSCLAIAPITPHFMNTPPPIGPVPVIIPHTETFWLPLRYSLSNWVFAKISSDVEYEGWGFGAVQLDHDMGFLIPHIPWGPPSVLLAAHIAFSKCKVMFGKASVKINDKQAGWWYWFAPFQVCANPFHMPLGIDFSYFYTTIYYGFSLGDLICGWIRIAIDAVITVFFQWLGGWAAEHLLEHCLGWAALKVAPYLGRLLDELLGPLRVVYLTRYVLEHLPEAIADKIREKGLDFASEDPFGELSRSIDGLGHEAPEPPEPQAHSPMAPDLNTVPMAP